MTRRARYLPPERLTDEERAELRRWAAEKQRWALNRLLDLEEACLDHFRAKPPKEERNWLATVRNWVRNQPNFAPRSVPPSAVMPRPAPSQQTARFTAAEMSQIAEREKRIRERMEAERGVPKPGPLKGYMASLFK